MEITLKHYVQYKRGLCGALPPAPCIKAEVSSTKIQSTLPRSTCPLVGGQPATTESKTQTQQPTLRRNLERGFSRSRTAGRTTIGNTGTLWL